MAQETFDLVFDDVSLLKAAGTIAKLSGGTGKQEYGIMLLFSYAMKNNMEITITPQGDGKRRISLKPLEISNPFRLDGPAC